MSSFQEEIEQEISRRIFLDQEITRTILESKRQVIEEQGGEEEENTNQQEFRESNDGL